MAVILTYMPVRNFNNSPSKSDLNDANGAGSWTFEVTNFFKIA